MEQVDKARSARWRGPLALVLAAALVAACGGGKSGASAGAGSGDGSSSGGSGSGTGTGTGTGTSGSGTGTGSGDFTALSWAQTDPATQYTLADGTLVTQIGGRVRDRHAREQPDTPGTGDPYDLFAAHYFERRSHQITIYDNVSPTNPANHVLTVVVRPQWWLYGTNFRSGYIGRRDGDLPGPTAVALYGDNGGMKRLPAGTLLSGQELKTPIANYDALGADPSSNYDTDLAVPPKDGEFVLVKQITSSASLRRPLQAGDLIEFELGIFLAGNQGDALGRFNYYSDVTVYKVGSAGARAWYRGPSSDPTLIPWDSKLVPDEALAGGMLMTLQEDTSNQPEMNFMQAGTNIAGIDIQPFQEGRRLFHTSFLTGTHPEADNPVFTAQAGKAGPKFQQPSCIACHAGDGKSTPAQAGALNTMVVLTGDSDANGNPVPDARFGGHLEQGLVTDAGKTFDGRQAILGIASYKTTAGSYPDGTAYTLQTPQYALTDTSGKALDMPAHLSVRAAPHLVGMGLLEAVPESSLQALVAAGANDPDGAKGKLQIVTDLKDPTLKRVGRFGWRATTATVEQQTAAALNGDIGVTTSILPKRLCGLAAAATDCRAADATQPPLSNADLDLLVHYLSTLAVPPARHFAGEQPLGVTGPTIVAQAAAQTSAQIAAENTLQARVAAGKTLFGQLRCTACHVPSLTTGTTHRFAELRGQMIAPYTDLLLHDMGPDLADTFPQGNATAQEWRTAPLWGLGLLASINPNVRYLHDGRARTIEEAILWHGGQAAASRDRFKALSADDRQKVIDMVVSR
jgi:CxxC motif-containing protein (DUF1111 family)